MKDMVLYLLAVYGIWDMVLHFIVLNEYVLYL